MISYDDLPQKQQLILQVLTAHWQLGHTTVDFPIVLHPSLAHLEKQGLITFPGPGSLKVVTTQSTAAARAILTGNTPARRLTPAPLRQQPKATPPDNNPDPALLDIIRDLTTTITQDFGDNCRLVGLRSRCATHGWNGPDTCPVLRARHYLNRTT